MEGRSGSDVQLTQLMQTIRAAYPQRAQWSFWAKDTTVLDQAIKGDDTTQTAGGTTTAAGAPKPAGADGSAQPTPSDQLPDMQKMMEDSH